MEQRIERIQDETEETLDSRDDGADQGTDTFFYITIGLIVLVVFGVIFIPKLLEKEDTGPKTIDQIMDDAFREGESDIARIYNGFVFVHDGTIWHSRVKNPDTGETFRFGVRFNPYQVENVTIEGNIDDSFRNSKKIFITFDPYEDELTYVALAATELSLNINRSWRVPVGAACMEEHPDCGNNPIFTCNTTDETVIEFVVSDETKLVLDGNCMRIQGRGFELLRVVDRVIFQAYGIM